MCARRLLHFMHNVHAFITTQKLGMQRLQEQHPAKVPVLLSWGHVIENTGSTALATAAQKAVCLYAAERRRSGQCFLPLPIETNADLFHITQCMTIRTCAAFLAAHSHSTGHAFHHFTLPGPLFMHKMHYNTACNTLKQNKNSCHTWALLTQKSKRKHVCPIEHVSFQYHDEPFPSKSFSSLHNYERASANRTC